MYVHTRFVGCVLLSYFDDSHYSAIFINLLLLFSVLVTGLCLDFMFHVQFPRILI
jgi:hypothetical protein